MTDQETTDPEEGAPVTAATEPAAPEPKAPKTRAPKPEAPKADGGLEAQRITPGRIVTYVDGLGASHPAMCVTASEDHVAGLYVFARADAEDFAVHPMACPDVAYGENDPKGAYPPNSWHWPERS